MFIECSVDRIYTTQGDREATAHADTLNWLRFFSFFAARNISQCDIQRQCHLVKGLRCERKD